VIAFDRSPDPAVRCVDERKRTARNVDVLELALAMPHVTIEHRTERRSGL
jgi:hypothetical protein